MENIILDFTNCKYIDEVYEIIKKEFDFPDYFGKNFYALWDCLDYYTDEPTHITILGLDTLPADFYEYMYDVLEIFDDINDVMPYMTFEAVSKKYSFKEIRRKKRENLKKEYVSFKFDKDPESMFYTICGIFLLPHGVETFDFTPLEKRLGEYSHTGLEIILVDTNSLLEKHIPFLNDFIDFLKTMHEEYPLITWSIMS